MARPINSNPVVLKGKEAKQVLEKIENPNLSPEYRVKMKEYVSFYQRIEKESSRKR